MGFDNPDLLWLLLVLSLPGILFVYVWNNFHLFEKSPTYKVFDFHSKLPNWTARYFFGFLRLLILSLVVFGLTEPYLKLSVASKEYKNVRVFFLLDVSGSMIYGEDIPPNRLIAARKEIAKFYNQLDGSYPCALIPFAGEANRYYCPLTSRQSVFIPLLEKAGPETAPTLGTNLPEAFGAAEQMIKENNLDKEGINIIMLVTDGGKEEADQTSRSKLLQTVARLSRGNSRIYAVGIGSREKIALVQRDKKGGFIDFVRNEDKSVAQSELDEDVLHKIADSGRGRYQHFEASDQLYAFLDRVIKENRIADKDRFTYTKTTLQTYCFTTAAILLWLVFISNRTRY